MNVPFQLILLPLSHIEFDHYHVSVNIRAGTQFIEENQITVHMQLLWSIVNIHSPYSVR